MKTTLILLLAAGLVGSVISHPPKTNVNTNVSLNAFVHPPVTFKPGPEYGPEARNIKAFLESSEHRAGGFGRSGMQVRYGRINTTMWSRRPAVMTARHGATSSS